MLDRIRIVLVNTSHPGNIGSAARAMKTMGLSDLVVVDPECFPHPKAQEMASGAGDLVEQAKIVYSLDEAIADCHMVIGASARSRAIPWPLQTPREMAEDVAALPEETQIALLFGRERSGLTNEELHRCHKHVNIPANPDYSSLNLAASVQVMAYELRMASLAYPKGRNKWDYPFATSEELEHFYTHLEMTMTDIGFHDPSNPRQLMTRLRRLFNRARVDRMEMNILRGILTAVQAQKPSS